MFVENVVYAYVISSVEIVVHLFATAYFLKPSSTQLVHSKVAYSQIVVGYLTVSSE